MIDEPSGSALAEARLAQAGAASAEARQRAGAQPKAPPRRRGRSGATRPLRLAAAAFILGAGAVFALAPPVEHGAAAVLFPPWIPEREALRIIDQAGGVALAEQGGLMRGPLGAIRAIGPDAAFAARLRADGAWLVLPSAP